MNCCGFSGEVVSGDKLEQPPSCLFSFRFSGKYSALPSVSVRRVGSQPCMQVLLFFGLPIVKVCAMDFSGDHVAFAGDLHWLVPF